MEAFDIRNNRHNPLALAIWSLFYDIIAITSPSSDWRLHSTHVRKRFAPIGNHTRRQIQEQVFGEYSRWYRNITRAMCATAHEVMEYWWFRCSLHRNLRGGGLRFRSEAGHIPFPHYNLAAAWPTQEDARRFQEFPWKIYERVLIALRSRSHISFISRLRWAICLNNEHYFA